MTLLVGVLCEDGVVLGADSAATMGSGGMPTVRQPVAKIRAISNDALIAVSGPVGLGQRLAGELEQILSESRIPSSMKAHKATQLLRQSFMPYIAGELEAARIAAPVVGAQVAQASALSSTLLAIHLDGRIRLVQFDQQGAPEEATVDLPFVCLGSGQLLADPFMTFLRGVFWDKGRLPSLAEATFATVWTLTQAIDVSPAYLAEPIHVFTLTQESTLRVARELEPSELQEHRQAASEARAVLRSWRRVDNLVPPPPDP